MTTSTPICPKCHSSEITHQQKQVRAGQPIPKSILWKSFGILISLIAVLAIVFTLAMPSASEAVGRYSAMASGLITFIGMMVWYLKTAKLRTMHTYTCRNCRKMWAVIDHDSDQGT